MVTKKIPKKTNATPAKRLLSVILNEASGENKRIFLSRKAEVKLALLKLLDGGHIIKVKGRFVMKSEDQVREELDRIFQKTDPEEQR